MTSGDIKYIITLTFRCHMMTVVTRQQPAHFDQPYMGRGTVLLVLILNGNGRQATGLRQVDRECSLIIW